LEVISGVGEAKEEPYSKKDTYENEGNMRIQT
jgi:hypothetical protein